MVKGASWEGPSPRWPAKIALRVVRHLTRRAALAAIALAAVASLGAATVDPGSSLGQVLLVLVGILVSVVVLPDTPHRLWNVTPRDLADTVPSPHLLDASRAVAEAIALQAEGPLPETVIAALWEDALHGIGDVIDDPSHILLDLSYRIQVTPGEDSPPVVVTSISSTRCVPQAKDGRVWFSFCSNLEALSGEFSEHGNGCVGRELIDRSPGESLESWASRVSDYQIDLTVDGKAAARYAHEQVSGEGWRVLRVPFEAGKLGEQFVPVEIVVEFHADMGQRRFPVKFSAYFVEGATQVTFEVCDPDADVVCDEYLASAARSVTVIPTRTLRAVGYRIRASAGTILPPGAGVVFSWENAPKDRDDPGARGRRSAAQ